MGDGISKVDNGGFQNVELETGVFGRDIATNVRTHGNAMLLGNFVAGDPTDVDSYDWYGVFEP